MNSSEVDMSKAIEEKREQKERMGSMSRVWMDEWTKLSFAPTSVL
jgi:hypothetical protein